MRYVTITFIIFILIVLGVLIFGHGSKKPAPAVTKSLPDYSNTDVQVQFTTDGQINGDDQHRQIVISIDNTSRTLSVIGGYEGRVIRSETLNNNQSAYKAFLSALQVSGFTKIRKSKITTEAGQCPLGQRFIYQVNNTGQADLRTWSTSCGGAATFGGQAAVVQQLFQNQFANYDQYTSDVVL